VTARLLERWRAQQERVDTLLETLPRELGRAERARIQNLLFGAIRHRGRIDAHLDRLLQRPPRTIIWAILLLAGYELIEGGAEGHAAKVGHHAVEQAKRLASPKEAGMVNAVVRRLAAALADEPVPDERASSTRWAQYHSHPEWMVDRWWGAHGPEATRQLLEFNQTPAPVFARWRSATRPPTEAELVWLRPVADAPEFFELGRGHWEEAERLLAEGVIQVQDPATRHAVDLLAPKTGETVLDLCAAPGGKSLLIADRLQEGKVVSLDLPGPRLNRLQRNLAKAPAAVQSMVVAGDLRTAGSRLLPAQGVPAEFSAVLIDLPCSNTGVMRHRVDVKWRLEPTDIRKHSLQQYELLDSAARLVEVGGRLVYSTCSLEAEENAQVVDAFIRRSRGAWERVDERYSRPWETGHDGAAAFLLRRIS
jgi:16S rRNA (cytosine967-C5)-methyltransferase